MSSETIRSRDPDIQASAKALRRAAKRALALGIRTKTPVYVIHDGTVVDLTRSKKTKHKARSA